MPDSQRTLPAEALIEVSTSELRQQLADRTISSAMLVRASLDRIASLDHQGPALHAVIETNPDAPRIAAQLDAERLAGAVRSPLHGLPVLVKDNIATIDPMETTAGSCALIGSRPTRDAFLVERLRAAGAIVLGKSNLSEWSNFRSTHSLSGWSGRGGQCVNPYQLDRTPWGSSAGSAVAVAASYVPFAVGTETDGSIVTPCGANGVVGIKPTVGLVSRSGVIPISHSQDTVGPIARSVADAALLLNVLAAPDPDDAATSGDPDWSHHGSTYPRRPAGLDADGIDYTASLDLDGLRGARIGVLRSAKDPRFAEGVLAPILASLRDAGATVVDPIALPGNAVGRGSGQEGTVLLHEFKVGIADYLGRISPDGPMRSLADLIAFNDANADHELRWFGQELFLNAEATEGLDAPAYREAIVACQEGARRHGIDALLGEHHLDAIIMLTNGPAPKIDVLNGDFSSWGSSSLAAMAGYPLLTVPAAILGGMPIGLTFMGGAYSETTLIRLAYAFEQRTRVRSAPPYAGPGVLPPC
ncbi:MAG: amidase [Thermomicrobiales bacterium]